MYAWKEKRFPLHSWIHKKCTACFLVSIYMQYGLVYSHTFYPKLTKLRNLFFRSTLVQSVTGNNILYLIYNNILKRYQRMSQMGGGGLSAERNAASVCWMAVVHLHSISKIFEHWQMVKAHHQFSTELNRRMHIIYMFSKKLSANS